MSGTTEHVNGERKKWVHGKAVVYGVPQYTSVSALELSIRCTRRWWYRYLGGLKEPDSKAAARGIDGHARIAHYLTTGDRSRLNALVMRGMHQLPPPGPDLLVEYDFVPNLPDGSSGLARAVLRADGIPLVGAMDVVHERPENYGVADVADAVDEPGVLKIIDHKFTGGMDYAKDGPELVKQIQMAGYGLWAFNTFTGLKRVRLTHNYFPTKGAPRAPTALVTREQCEETWMSADAAGVSIRDAARETDPDRVPANTNACFQFGKECPAFKVCKAARFDSLSELVGGAAAESYLLELDADLASNDISDLIPPGAIEPAPGQPRHHLPVLNQGNLPMTTPAAPNSLLAFVQGASVPAPQLPGQAPPSVGPSVEAEVARLQAGLNVQAAPALQAPAPMAPPAPALQAPAPLLQVAPAPAAPPAPTAADYVQAIEACGHGFPTTSAGAAAYMSALRGRPLNPDGTLPGYGTLAVYNIPDVVMFPQALDEVRAFLPAVQAPVAPPAPAPIAPPQTAFMGATSIMPPEAPIPNAAALAPMAAHVSAEDTAAKKAADKEAAKLAKEQEKAAKKAAKEAEKAAKVTAPAPVAPCPTPIEAIAPVSEPAPIPVVNTVIVQAAPAVTEPTNSKINVYVDCTVDGLKLESLSPLLNATFAWMCKDAGALDFREPSEGKYAFGRWRGIIAGCIRGAAKAGHIQGGNYGYESSGEISSAVIEALREVATASGGAFIKGVR